jgi:hypothetical protein
MRKFGMIGVLLLASAPLYAQDEVARKQAVEVAARVPLEKSTKGAPYSAETIVEGSQTLADGNHINRKTTGRVYRDSEGRTRREEDRANGTVGISIIDPVAGVSYSLDPENKIAWKTPAGGGAIIMNKLEAAVEANRKMEMEKKAPDEKMTEQALKERQAAEAKMKSAADEQKVRMAIARGRGDVMMGDTGFAFDDKTPLEHKTIEGVAVDGRKTTTVIPAGRIGNEQPITITSEEWRSPELNILVLTKHSDPRSGDSSYRLVNIIRAEPDRSLFMVPPDYTVKETGIRKMLEESRKQ